MPLKSAKTFKEEEYWANLYGETIATPTADLPPATPEPEPEMGNFTRGLNMAVDEAQGLGGGVKALVGSSIGNDEWVDSGMEIYQRNMDESKQYAGDIEKIEDIESLDDFGKWTAHTVGRFLPDIGMAVVSGGIGGAVTKKVVKEGIKSKANDQAQDIVQAGIEKDAADYIARMFAEKEAADAVGKAAFRGSMVGAAAYTGQQSAGGSFARILEETGVEAPLTALGVGIISGGLEAAPFMKVFSSIFPKGKAKEFGEFIAGDLATKPPWVTSALIDVRDIMGINAVTEGLQLIVDDSAVTYVNNNFSENEAQEYANYLMDPEARSRMVNTLAVGALMGVTTGAGTVAVKGARGDYSNPKFDDQANQTRTESSNNPSQRQEILRIFNEHRNKAKSLTGGPAPFDPVSGKKATVWDGNGALNPETNQPYTPEDYTQAGVPLPPRPLDVEGDAGFLAENEPLTPEQRQEAGLSELTDYDGSDINVPQDIPEGTEPDAVLPESAPVIEAPQQPMFAEDSLPPSPESPQAPQADIVTDFDSAPAFGERSVPASSTESGTLYEYHNFEGQLSDPAKPVTDQLVELSVAATTPEALDPNNTDVVVEAIDVDDVDRIFDRNDFLKIETNDKKSGKSLPTIDESFGENAQEATDVVAGVVADLSASGVPRSFLDSVTGVYVHKESELDVPALTGNKSRGISFNSSLVSGAVSDPKQLSELAWSMTHEVYHAADYSMGLSDKDPQFGITIVSERDQPTVVMGDVMDEIFTNWENRTELGKRFDYPFNDLNKEINDLDKPNEGLVKSYRQEVFAQLGAMFHSNPKLLQEQSPLAYNFIKGIRDSNLKTNNVPEVQSEGTSSPSDPNTTESTGLRGQVRASPESGSVESAPVAGTGSDGEGSTGVGRTDSTVEGQAQKKTGQRQRPAVQEPNVKKYTLSEQTQEGNRQYTRAQRGVLKNTYYTEDERKNFVRGFRDGYQNTNGVSYNLDDNAKSGGSIYSEGYYSGSKDLRDINEENDNSGRDLNDGKGVPKDNSSYKQKQASRQSKPIEDTPVTIKLSDKKPTFKKAENWEDTGTLTVTFADGDRYQVYFDEDTSEGRDSGDDDVYYQSIDGKVADADLGTTKKESIQAIIDHREKLFAAGKNSFNTPLDAEVGSDTYSKGYDLIVDSPEGKLKLTDLRKKFKKLDDNQFDNLVEKLLDSEPDFFGTPKEAEDIFEMDGDFIVNPETVKIIEEEGRFQDLMDGDLDDPSFIKKGAEYLLEKSEGEIPSKKLVPVKSLTAKTDAEKNLAMVDTIVSNHPNALDSPESWSAFERELTGSNTTIAPPYGLIKLVNNPKLWAKKHSTLTPQQLEAADRGLATAKRMGALYESGAADSEATGKLLLWGLMSRMLTASAQEAGFVDLLTDSTAVTNLIEKALTGSFTDKTATRMVEVPKTKKKPKHMVEKTYNADIAEWRDYVQESIPQGSFGRSGTSNANDFGALMMKMSGLDDAGVSKLQRLHDLMADRSVSTAEVRRQFQAMVQGSGIDNKVFSFAQLMIGRDDVVILDRIQLNSMWDSDRYGKNIYDDIADEFGALRGAARYEAIENALKSKVKDLYTSLGRPADASVGRYHWESWVRDSGQVVAHPTMIGLENDIKGKTSPYALLGAPEGKMNTYAYSAIYARDEAGDSYYVYPNSNGTFFKFDLSKWIEFKKEIPKPKNGIVDNNFKVSDFDKGIPWYESDQVNRQKLDGLIESYAKRKALADEYSAEGAIASNDPNGFRRKRIYDRLRSPKSSDASGSQNETEISRRFGERPSRRTQVLVDGKSLPAYKRTLTPQAKKDLGLSDSYNGNIFELAPSKESAELFASRIQSSKDASKFGAAVDVHSPEKYQGMDLIITEDGTAGMASDGEYMTSLFSDGKTNKNVTYALMSLAIENGARTGDAFDTVLPSIYQDLGMRVVSRLKWDDSQAKDDWDKKTFKGYNNGEPDLVFLRHDPSYFDEYGNADGYYVDTYKEGLASLVDRDVEDVSFIKNKQNNAKNNTLDDGSPSTSQFSFKDEIDGQSDLRRRFNKGRNPTVRSLSDRYDDLKQFEDQAADYLEVGRIPASMSPRDQENLSHGKVQDDLNEFHKTYVDVIGDLIHKSGIDPESIGVYLLAKHAQERNANVFEKEKAQREKNIARTKKEIQKLEDDVEVDHTVAIATQQERLSLYETMPFKFEDSGSGMTNGEAQSVLNTAEREGTKGQMEEIASKVYEMLQFQRDRMVKAGLLDEVSKADWEDTFKFYVPLKGFAAEENGDSYVRGSASRGFSIVGSESMKAKGRKTLPVNPLLTAIEDVQKKIIRARKNETAQTLLDLLSNLGTSDSYVIYNNKFRPPMESDPLTMQDLKSMSRDRRPNGDPKYVEVKKGGQTFFIYFKSDSLNHSLQNMSVPLLSRSNESIGKLLTFATRFQTFRRNMLINYNPSWGLVNPIRDVQTALMYGLSEMDKKGSRTQGKNIVGAMAKAYLPSMRSLYRYYREKPIREGNEIDQYTQEFHDDGAQTGLMLVRDQTEQLRILKSKLKKGYTREAIRSLLKFVEDFNTTMENSVRLSSYIEARKAGAPREDAATLAKDLTVNFNRKGEDSATVNALYLFFNAAVQGNVNIMQALGNDGSSGKRFTTAQKTASGLVALGASLALMNILNSEDDDDGDKKYEDLPEHAKNRSLLIMGLDGEEGFALPAPYGYNFFTNIGRYGTELAMGVTEVKDVAVNLFDNILLNFVPITPSAGDNWAEKMRGFYPDLLELHLDLVANKDFFGSDIAVEQNPLFVKRSQAYVAKRGTGKNFKEIAKFMNDATGGDEFEDGLIWFSPDRMQYAYSYFFGGLGRSVSQSGDVMGLMAADEEVRKQDMPIISTFFKRPSEYADRFEYYDNWEEVRQIKTQLIQTTDPQEKADLIKRFNPFFTTQAGEEMPVLHEKDVPNLYDIAHKDLTNIRRSRKLVEKQNYGAGALGEEKRKQILDGLEESEHLIFDLFNKAYRKAVKKAKG